MVVLVVVGASITVAQTPFTHRGNLQVPVNMVAMVFRMWREAGLKHAGRTCHFASMSVFLVSARLRNQFWQVVNRRVWSLSIPFLHIYYSSLCHKGQTHERSKIWSCRRSTLMQSLRQINAHSSGAPHYLKCAGSNSRFRNAIIFLNPCVYKSRLKNSSLQIFSISHMCQILLWI